MNKLLKVTLITAIMATSGMCMSGECQRTTFEAGDNIDYNLGHTASHDSTWITEATKYAYTIDNVKVEETGRWINKGHVLLQGKNNSIKGTELINEGQIDIQNGAVLDIKDSSRIDIKPDGRIYVQTSILDIIDNNSVCLGDNSYLHVANKGNINVVGNNSICLRNKAHIRADNASIIDVKCNSAIYIKDSAYIQAHNHSTITINEGCIFDARDSKDLSNWNTNNGTFKMLPGSIMYLPKEVTNKASKFTITLPSEGKPVELRYIMNTDIAFDGLCPAIDCEGHDYGHKLKLDGANRELNTGIKFIGDTNRIRLTPIYTGSISAICDGEKTAIIKTTDFGC